MLLHEINLTSKHSVNLLIIEESFLNSHQRLRHAPVKYGEKLGLRELVWRPMRVDEEICFALLPRSSKVIFPFSYFLWYHLACRISYQFSFKAKPLPSKHSSDSNLVNSRFSLGCVTNNVKDKRNTRFDTKLI